MRLKYHYTKNLFCVIVHFKFLNAKNILNAAFWSQKEDGLNQQNWQHFWEDV